jgi:hypothetical protein
MGPLVTTVALSSIGVLAAVGLWVGLARLLAARIRSRLRAVPLALPLLMVALGYGAFWLAFFSSPATAVQLHAIRLTVAHFAGPLLPWTVGSWLVVSAWALKPLVMR